MLQCVYSFRPWPARARQKGESRRHAHLKNDHKITPHYAIVIPASKDEAIPVSAFLLRVCSGSSEETVDAQQVLGPILTIAERQQKQSCCSVDVNSL